MFTFSVINGIPDRSDRRHGLRNVWRADYISVWGRPEAVVTYRLAYTCCPSSRLGYQMCFSTGHERQMEFYS